MLIFFKALAPLNHNHNETAKVRNIMLLLRLKQQYYFKVFSVKEFIF